MIDPLRPLFSRARAFQQEATEDRLTGLAAEVAFFAVLGMFPALLAIAAALGFVQDLLGGDVAVRAQQVVTEFLSTFLTDRAAETVEAVRALFDKSDPALLSAATAGALWAVWRTIRAVMRALTVVYDVREARSLIRTLLLTLALALSTIVVTSVMLVMFVLGPLFGGGEAIADLVGLGDVFVGLWRWVRFPVGLAVLVLWAAMMFHFAPNHRSSFRSDLPGAVVTGALWLLFSGGLRFYLAVAGSVNQVLGVIGGLLTVLIWLYLLSLALLIGAEINFVTAASEEPDRSGG